MQRVKDITDRSDADQWTSPVLPLYAQRRFVGKETDLRIQPECPEYSLKDKNMKMYHIPILRKHE